MKQRYRVYETDDEIVDQVDEDPQPEEEFIMEPDDIIQTL